MLNGNGHLFQNITSHITEVYNQVPTKKQQQQKNSFESLIKQAKNYNRGNRTRAKHYTKSTYRMLPIKIVKSKKQ